VTRLVSRRFLSSMWPIASGCSGAGVAVVFFPAAVGVKAVCSKHYVEGNLQRFTSSTTHPGRTATATQANQSSHRRKKFLMCLLMVTPVVAADLAPCGSELSKLAVGVLLKAYPISTNRLPISKGAWVALWGCVYKVGIAQIILTFSTDRRQPSLQAQSEFRSTGRIPDKRVRVSRGTAGKSLMYWLPGLRPSANLRS
jgi:hypothetical protein